MWMGTKDRGGKWAKKLAVHLSPQTKRVAGGPSKVPNAGNNCHPPFIQFSLIYIHIYIPSFPLLPPFSSFLHVHLFTHPSIYINLPTHLYHICRFCQNRSSSLFILLLFVQIILGIFLVITLSPPPTNPLLFIYLFMMRLFHAFAPTITNNLNFDFTVVLRFGHCQLILILLFDFLSVICNGHTCVLSYIVIHARRAAAIFSSPADLLLQFHPNVVASIPNY